jgi:hypothetical protein
LIFSKRLELLFWSLPIFVVLEFFYQIHRGCVGLTFDHALVLESFSKGFIGDWHSPFYTLIAGFLSEKFNAFAQFYFQAVIYYLSVVMIIFVTRPKIFLAQIFLVLGLLSPVFFLSLREIGKDQLFLSLVLFNVATLLSFIKTPAAFFRTFFFINTAVSAILIILIRPNAALFFLPILFFLFKSDCLLKKIAFLYLLSLLASVSIFFYSEQIILFLKFNLSKEYYFQYVFSSDIINIAISTDISSYIDSLKATIQSCDKYLDIQSAKELKNNNQVNIKGIWNIDPFYLDKKIGVCKVTSPQEYDAIKTLWAHVISENKFQYILSRLCGFMQLFYHETNTFLGKASVIFYSPLWLFFAGILYRIKSNSTISTLFICFLCGSAFYLGALFFVAPGFDLRYNLPVFIFSILSIYFNIGNSNKLYRSC